MRTNSLNHPRKQFLENAELGFIILYLLFAESVSIPTQLSMVLNILNYAFLGVMVLRLWKRMAYVVTLDLSLIALVGFAICSALWSVGPDYSLRMALGMLRITVFGIYLATCFSFQSQLKIFAWVSGWIVAVNLFICAAFPSLGIKADPNNFGELAFVGIYTHKQILGRVMALALITLLVYFRIYAHHRWLSGLAVLGATFLLLLSHSSTSLISVVIAILLFPLHQITKQGFKLRTILLITTLLIGVVVLGFVIVNWESLVTSVLAKGTTFNGRTPVWTLAMEKLMKRPLLGYGYAAFWASDEGWQIYTSVPWTNHNPAAADVQGWHAHNAFLDLSLQLGMLGVAILLFNVALVLYRSVTLMNRTHSLESFWMLQFLLIQLIGSTSEAPSHLSNYSIYWIIYVAMAYSSAILLRSVRQNRLRPIAALELSP